mmetsp:Transcript_56833/g.128798  ORF Transcript_56833/g.128798 Transcript_56833/m.128798 type:complete len:313 (+) Transcript_56833:114-1052(+)
MKGPHLTHIFGENAELTFNALLNAHFIKRRGLFSEVEITGMSHGGCDYGLEDKMLRKNIAGRYSTWEKDSDEEGPSSRTEWRKESNESHFSKKCTVDRASLSPPRHAVNGRGRAGPKGVLEDYREHLEVNAMAIAAEAEERRTEILLHCYGTTGSPKFLADVHDFAGDSEDDDEEDRAACERYRAQRQAELQSEALLPVFGAVKKVSTIGLVDAIDSQDPRVTVLVLVGDDSLRDCRMMERTLAQLTEQNPRGMLVLALQAAEANLVGNYEFDPSTLPTLVAYRDGELMASIVCAAEALRGAAVLWVLYPTK